MVEPASQDPEIPFDDSNIVTLDRYDLRKIRDAVRSGKVADVDQYKDRLMDAGKTIKRFMIGEAIMHHQPAMLQYLASELGLLEDPVSALEYTAQENFPDAFDLLAKGYRAKVLSASQPIVEEQGNVSSVVTPTLSGNDIMRPVRDMQGLLEMASFGNSPVMMEKSLDLAIPIMKLSLERMGATEEEIHQEIYSRLLDRAQKVIHMNKPALLKAMIKKSEEHLPAAYSLGRDDELIKAAQVKLGLKEYANTEEREALQDTMQENKLLVSAGKIRALLHTATIETVEAEDEAGKQKPKTRLVLSDEAYEDIKTELRVLMDYHKHQDDQKHRPLEELKFSKDEENKMPLLMARMRDEANEAFRSKAMSNAQKKESDNLLQALFDKVFSRFKGR
ncbi:MAG: hypothetical protein SFT92_01730 [Rickettsiales bacterium]|nr:hypothetical protein [Rickettsiales bacterium]